MNGKRWRYFEIKSIWKATHLGVGGGGGGGGVTSGGHIRRSHPGHLAWHPARSEQFSQVVPQRDDNSSVASFHPLKKSVRSSAPKNKMAAANCRSLAPPSPAYCCSSGKSVHRGRDLWDNQRWGNIRHFRTSIGNNNKQKRQRRKPKRSHFRFCGLPLPFPVSSPHPSTPSQSILPLINEIRLFKFIIHHNQTFHSNAR